MENLCLDFINSQWYTSHTPFKDGLSDPEWLQTWSHKWEFILPEVLSSEDIRSLYWLRGLLSNSLDHLSQGLSIPQQQISELNTFLEQFPLYYSLTVNDNGYTNNIKNNTDAFNGVLLSIAISFLELVSENDLERIKRCQNPNCGWAFFDESKNNTRKWCGNTCSSLIKVRRFRARQKNQPAE